MEMGLPTRPSTRCAEKQASRPSEEQLRVITKWVGIFMEHHHKEVSELGMVGYIEGLCDLHPEQIDRACALALREVEGMPKVAHIRARIFEIGPVGNRPDYLDEPPTSEEERTEALKFSAKLKETLQKMAPESQKVAFTPTGSVHDDAAYIAWLEEQNQKDEMERSQGMSPLPRSKEERLALFYTLPISERRRLKKKAEWAKR